MLRRLQTKTKRSAFPCDARLMGSKELDKVDLLPPDFEQFDKLREDAAVLLQVERLNECENNRWHANLLNGSCQ